MIQENRVVVTGLGVVTPIGIGKEKFWAACLAGTNGIGRITRFDPTDYTSQIAGEVQDFDPAQFIDKKEIKRMDRYTQFALAATRLAVDDAGLKNIDSERGASSSARVSAAWRLCIINTRNSSAKVRRESARSLSR